MICTQYAGSTLTKACGRRSSECSCLVLRLHVARLPPVVNNPHEKRRAVRESRARRGVPRQARRRWKYLWFFCGVAVRGHVPRMRCPQPRQAGG